MSSLVSAISWPALLDHQDHRARLVPLDPQVDLQALKETLVLQAVLGQ